MYKKVILPPGGSNYLPQKGLVTFVTVTDAVTNEELSQNLQQRGIR